MKDDFIVLFFSVKTPCSPCTQWLGGINDFEVAL
jgi:hypothetical protein